jgi:hypothetical protein
LLGVDTIREMRVITSAYNAEYGRFTGGVISAVTKSGTNEFHGTVFEYHRNSALDARNFFDRDPINPLERSKVPNFIRNQFGFTLGGPIVPDKTFFFGSFEGLRERLTITEISNFPNDDAHNGIMPNISIRGRNLCGPPFGPPALPKCDVGVDPRVQPYLDLFPRVNGKDNGDGNGEVFFQNPRPTNENYYLFKLDHKFTDSDDFFIRMTIDDGDFSELNEGILYTIFEENLNQYWTLEEKHIFSPSLLNEFRFAFNRSTSRTEELGDVDESLWLSDVDRQKEAGFEGGVGLLFCRGCGISQWGTSTRTPQINVLNTFQYIDNLVWNRGNHSLKMGVSFSRFQFNASNFARLQGTYQFTDLNNFLQAQFDEATVYFGDLESGVPQGLGMRQSLVGIYLQDDVQVKPNLTLNLGVRYEFITSPSEVAGRLGNLNSPLDTEVVEGNPYFENPSLKNFSPRVGFAWDPTSSGKFSVRGGFGLFHQQVLTWCCTSALFRSYPFGIRGNLPNETHQAELDTFPDALKNLDSNHASLDRPSMFAVNKPVQPYLMQWSLTLQQELTASMAATATYAGSRGVHLPRVGDANRPFTTPIPGGGGSFYPDRDAARPNDRWSDITDRTWDANSYYHALRLGLRQRFTAGNMFQLSYTWQKSIDNGSAIAGSPRETFNDAWLSQDLRNVNLDRGLSAFSIAHSFTANWGTELPFGAGRRYGSGATGFLGQLIGGWQINGIITMMTGPPATLEGNPFATCAECNSILASIKPGESIPKTEDPNGWWVANMDTITDEEFPFLQPADPSDRWFQEGAPPAGYFGNVARNIGIGPGLATLDFSILKDFYTGERAQIQFRAEFFNILNRSNFQINFRERNTHSRGFSINRSFGKITETASTSRQIQLALRITF